MEPEKEKSTTTELDEEPETETEPDVETEKTEPEEQIELVQKIANLEIEIVDLKPKLTSIVSAEELLGETTKFQARGKKRMFKKLTD